MSHSEDIPEKHYVARYCRPHCIDQSGRTTAGAFELRKNKNEDHLSANWMERCTGRVEVDRQIECVRKAMQHIGFNLSKNGRFARMNVGEIKKIDNLQVKSIPSPQNPSHAGIYYDSAKDENRSITAQLAKMVKSDDIFPAV